MTQETTDERRTRSSRLRSWSGETAGITKGWLALSVILGWVFLASALFAAVRTIQLDNQVAVDRVRASVEQQVRTCEATNAVRAETRIVSLSAVDEDRRIWTSIDLLLDGGIPEPTRTLIDESLIAREQRINDTYVQRDCSEIQTEVANS